jgi:cell wall-associated NlpC family hydrolase
MDMQHYPNHIENAITVQGVYERIFPTEVPSYSDVHTPGAFYPFDNFQASYLAAGVPVKIIQISQDKAWDLIEVGNANYGCWVPAQNIATVNSAFIKKWQTNLGYLGVKSDNLSLTNNNIFYYKSRMGEIYPIDKISKDNISIKIAIKNINGEAEIQQGVIPQSETYILPLVTTPHNIALIANQFINKPYGWGDLYGYRDCSSTTKNIFAYFGIWLDRNSALQKDLGGTDISLENLSDSQKQKLIQQKAIPFFSLLYIPGHIVIYLGEKNNTAYVFQNMWGLRTFRPFQSQGRKIIGKTVITPITFGKEYWDVPKTVLDRVTHLIILGDTAS